MSPKKYSVPFALGLSAIPFLVAAEETSREQVCERTYCREPATVTLRLDEETVMDFQVEGIPVAYERDANIFAGEEVYLSVNVDNGEIQSVTYDPSKSQPDSGLLVRFTQNDDEHFGMMLIVDSSLDKFIRYRAFIALPNQDGFSYTSSCPVEPGTSVVEAWPYPISHLVMTDIHFIEIDTDGEEVTITCD